MFRDEIFWKTLRFPAKKYHILILKLHIRMTMNALGRRQIHAPAFITVQKLFQAFVDFQLDKRPVIQPCTFQAAIINGETQGFYKMQLCPYYCTIYGKKVNKLLKTTRQKFFFGI